MTPPLFGEKRVAGQDDGWKESTWMGTLIDVPTDTTGGWFGQEKFSNCRGWAMEGKLAGSLNKVYLIVREKSYATIDGAMYRMLSGNYDEN